jgi:hypothetical protein
MYKNIEKNIPLRYCFFTYHQLHFIRWLYGLDYNKEYEKEKNNILPLKQFNAFAGAGTLSNSIRKIF